MTFWGRRICTTSLWAPTFRPIRHSSCGLIQSPTQISSACPAISFRERFHDWRSRSSPFLAPHNCFLDTGLFDNGIGAFNGVADLINHVQPDTQWTSLGEIARHSHLVRRRADGALDVWMFSNEMDLKNPTDEDAVFYIKKDEDLSLPIRSLTIDGAPAAFERSTNMLGLRLLIPAHQLRKLRIVYQNDLDLARVDIRKNNVYAYALRWISDFRDLYLSRFSLGRDLIQAYYDHDGYSVELYLERKWSVGITCLGLTFGGLWHRGRKAIRRVTQRATRADDR